MPLDQDSEDSAESAKSRASLGTPMGKETVHELLRMAEEQQLPRLRHRCEALGRWYR